MKEIEISFLIINFFFLVKISFDNYRSLHPAYLNHQEEEEEGEVDGKYHTHQLLSDHTHH